MATKDQPFSILITERMTLYVMASPDVESLCHGHQTQNLYVLATLDKKSLCDGHPRQRIFMQWPSQKKNIYE